MNRTPSSYIAIAIAALMIILPADLMAGDAYDDDSRQKTPALKYRLDLDLAVISISTAGWTIMELLKDDMAPAGCRWCGVNGLDEWGHDNLKWSNTKSAQVASNITAYALAPIAAFGLDALAAQRHGELDNFWVDALVISEAATVSSLVSQIVKSAVGRQRPEYRYNGPPNGPSENNVSFYSGHTSLAFSLAVSSGTVATMRNYEMAPWIWGTGLAIATTTGYLRIAADKHYITDVIAGAVAGSAFGFGIPYLFHRNKDEGGNSTVLTAAPRDGGMTLNIAGRL